LRLSRFFALLLAAGFATAVAAQETVTCKDGTTSKGGKGACSGHGGIDKKATPDAKEAAPAPQAETVVCKDGTSSKGGKGACSGHGGVDKKAKPPAAAAPSAPAPASPAPAQAAPASPAAAAPAPVAKAQPASQGSGEKSKSVNTDPTGAIARCKDGTYSHSKQHEGACSKHGGVGEWLDKK